MRFARAIRSAGFFFQHLPSRSVTAALSAPSGAPPSTIAAPPRTWRHKLSTHVARLTGKEIGELCNCDHTQASRIASGQRGATIGEWCDILEYIGFKVVPKHLKCVTAERLRFLETTTARALANEQVSEMLWEEPE